MNATRRTARGLMMVVTVAAGAALAGGPAAAATTATATAGDSTRTTAPTTPRKAAPDSGMALPAGEDGTVFRSLTIQGEDRIRLEIERPSLAFDLDPESAPGLDLGSTAEVLRRTSPDLRGPFVAHSAGGSLPQLARPWLSFFHAGAVARFRPEVQDVARWRLVVADARGQVVRTFEGKGRPPAEIVWDGRAADGSAVVPDLTYSYVFEAMDRAGNKRNFVGEGFRVSAYRMEGDGGVTLGFAARELRGAGGPGAAGGSAGTGTPAILIEAASWLNQARRPDRPVRISVMARRADEARALAESVARHLAPLLVGDPARVQAVPVVQPDAPEGGTVTIACVS